MERRIPLHGASSALVGLALLGLPTPGPLLAQSRAPWIHVRVEEPRRESTVHVNLPLSVVQVALAAAPEKVVSEGKVHLQCHGHDLSVADLRRLWKELKDAGDAEIVSIEDKDETVKVGRQGDRIRIRAEKPSRKETVHVDVPTALVDALLSGEGPTLNLRQGLAELEKLRGEIVQVDDANSHVRIWIDEGN